jgi:hypothetical protein
MAAGLGLGGSWFGPRLRMLWHHVPLHGGTAFAYVAGASCWVFCYLGNTNFSYRAVLLVLPARLWLLQVHDGKNGTLARRCFVLVLLLLWVKWGTGHVHTWSELNGDAFLPLLLMIVSLEQTLALLITAVLIISLCGWAMRRWKALETTK